METKQTTQKFEAIYRKVAVNTNYIDPGYPRMDNWSIDRYETATWFAAMCDGGYTRWIGKFNETGKVLWKVMEAYPKPISFHGITEEEFNQVEF